ncbi:hypothetical protein NXC24_PC02115 (plasmid) [Rhizobium sp. NXC24]|nr:hypothetical protein NXC24_PC02115 [Rhizobium sp. NXC24]
MLPRMRRKNLRHPVDLAPTEDPELTAFLMAEIEEAYSLSLDPPACFYCQSGNTVSRCRALNSPTCGGRLRSIDPRSITLHAPGVSHGHYQVQRLCFRSVIRACLWRRTAFICFTAHDCL